jgi:hypothetical protein
MDQVDDPLPNLAPVEYVRAIYPVVPSYNVDELEFDHDPALNVRDYDTEAGDFVPPQNDPAFLVLRAKDEHLHKTTGRKPGAELTATTRGSDIGEAKRTRDIRTTDAIHRAKMASKAGRFDEAASILASVKERKGKHRRPKRKIPARVNPWPPSRKFNSCGQKTG